MNYYFTIRKSILTNPLRRGTKYTISSEKSIFFDDTVSFGTIDDFIKECSDAVVDYIELNKIDEPDLNRLMQAIGDKITEVKLYHSGGSLSSLALLTKVIKLDIYSSAKKIVLWEIKSNKELNTLELQLSDCEILENIHMLKGSHLTNLKIYSGGISLVRPISVPLFDPSILASIEGLTKAEIHMLPPSDAVYALTELSRLSHLNRLSLDKNNFTFAQFAWLKSKLPDTRGFGGIIEFYPDRENDTHMMLICGSDWQDLPISEEQRVHTEFERLTVLYENEPMPPQN